MEVQLDLGVFQRVAVNTRKKRNAQLCRIDRAELDFRGTGALPGDIPGALYDVFVGEWIFSSGGRGDFSRPCEGAGVFLYCCLICV